MRCLQCDSVLSALFIIPIFRLKRSAIFDPAFGDTRRKLVDVVMLAETGDVTIFRNILSSILDADISYKIS